MLIVTNKKLTHSLSLSFFKRYITGVTAGSDFHGRKEGFDGAGGGGGNGEMDKNSRIFEVDSLNRDITAPGATLALGLMYIKSQ